VLRIFDANFNRCSEGLRVLEEVTRFILNDDELTKRLKKIRHRLSDIYSDIEPRLLTSRDSDSDVGIESSVSNEFKRDDLTAIVAANSRRVQESLRVLEEFAKLPASASIDAEAIKQSRFEIYSIERELVSAISRKTKADRIKGVYLIIDHDFLGDRNPIDVAKQAIEGGVSVIQLRDKRPDKGAILETARELRKLCADQNVLFIINDHVDIALASDADGVHLGQDDLPITETRALLPIDKIIGCTVGNIKEALQAQEQGADYIAVGSIYPTSSKVNIPIVGHETLRVVCDKMSISVVATGGITSNNAKPLIDTGANAIAVISVILNEQDIKAAARKMSDCIKSY
jgi:thiamine-phosphate pyrophosphorylase